MPLSRALARAMVPRLVKYGWSGNRIQRWLTSKIAGVNRMKLLADIRKYKNLAAFSPKIMALSPTVRIARALISEVRLTRPRKYRVYAQAKYTDLETGAIRYRQLSFYDDTERTKEEWADAFLQAKEEEEYLPTFSITNIDILAVEHNEGLAY